MIAPTRGPQLPDLPPPEAGALQETAWVEVVRKMEEVYSDLLRNQVDLEEKNAALEEAQRFIQSVLGSMSDVLVVCDRGGRVQQVNAAACALTGFTEAALMGRPAPELLDEASGTLAARLCEQRGGGPLQDLEVRLRKADGTLTDVVAMNCSARLDHRGRRLGTVLIGRPVGELRRAYEALNEAHAELKQAQQQLVQSEKLASLGRLVAGVAHEINNPISFIYGNVHMLARYRERLERYLDAVHGEADEAERERLRAALRIDTLLADLAPLVAGTLEGAERVRDIVKSLRRLSAMGRGEPECFDLGEVARTAVQWAVRGHKQAAQVDLELPCALPVRGDAGQLHQVIVNLVQNALDAAAGAEAPRVQVSGALAGGRVTVCVRDNGPGIPAEQLNRVFDPFFTTKPVGEGTGLGLWISYGIVKDHAGRIEAADAPGGGAEFSFWVPAARDAP